MHPTSGPAVHRLPRPATSTLASALALALVLTACGGGDDTAAGPTGTDTAGATEQVETAEASLSATDTATSDTATGDSAAPAPLDGAIVFSFSTPVAVDASGRATPLAPQGVSFDPSRFAVAADGAYAIMTTTDPADPNVRTETLVRFEAADGSRTDLAVLQTIDGSTGDPFDNLTRVLPAGASVYVARSTPDGVATLDRIDAASGELVGSVDLAGVSNPVADGTAVYGRVYGGLVRLDDAGTWQPVIAEGTLLRDVGPDVDLVAATVTEDGSPLSAENAESIESLFGPLEIDLDDAVITDDAIWWIASRFGISLPDGTQALHEAVARFDPAAGLITTWAPTAGLGARFLPDDADFDVATLGDTTLVVRGDALFVADGPVRDDAENGQLLRFDAATNALEVFYEPDPAGADYWTLDLLDTTTNDDGAVWVSIARHTIVEESSDGSRTSTFETTVVQLDPATGAELTTTPID